MGNDISSQNAHGMSSLDVKQNIAEYLKDTPGDYAKTREAIRDVPLFPFAVCIPQRPRMNCCVSIRLIPEKDCYECVETRRELYCRLLGDVDCFCYDIATSKLSLDEAKLKLKELQFNLQNPPPVISRRSVTDEDKGWGKRVKKGGRLERNTYVHYSSSSDECFPKEGFYLLDSILEKRLERDPKTIILSSNDTFTRSTIANRQTIGYIKIGDTKVTWCNDVATAATATKISSDAIIQACNTGHVLHKYLFGNIIMWYNEEQTIVENDLWPTTVLVSGEMQIFYASCNQKITSIILLGEQSLPQGAFEWCTNLCSFMWKQNKVSEARIGDRAFYSCSSLDQIIIPEGVIEIGQDVFWECINLAKISIPQSVIAIGAGAFNGCESLVQITIPEGVTMISENTFCVCSSLTEITIPRSVITIGDGAFWGCSSLAQITIPDSVTTIGGYAFDLAKHESILRDFQWDDTLQEHRRKPQTRQQQKQKK